VVAAGSHRPVGPATCTGHRPDVGRLDLDDALLADGLADLRWLLRDELLAGARVLVVDVSAVRQLSSTAVASLLWAHRTCRARGGGVVLRGVNRRTDDMLHRTGLWRVLQVEQAQPPRSR